VGQIIGPLVATHVALATGSYRLALLIAAGCSRNRGSRVCAAACERVIKEPKTLILHDELRSPKRSLKLKMPKPKAPSRNGLSAAKGLKTKARNPLDELLAAHAASASKIASALPFRAAA
jgi:hypothetical protein